MRTRSSRAAWRLPTRKASNHARFAARRSSPQCWAERSGTRDRADGALHCQAALAAPVDYNTYLLRPGQIRLESGEASRLVKLFSEQGKPAMGLVVDRLAEAYLH